MYVCMYVFISIYIYLYLYIIIVLASEQLGLDIAAADITPGYCSDHSLVCITFKTNIVIRNRSFWKFNNFLLRGAVFVNLVKQVILNVKKPYALTVYDRENIHLIEDEHLFLTSDGKCFYCCCCCCCCNITIKGK